MVDTKTQMMRLQFVKELQYHDFNQAVVYIDHGIDHALLYFWFNLLTCQYSYFPISFVMKEVMFFIQRNPEWEEEIVKWFIEYEVNLAARGSAV